ncbi:MAG TPA: rhodanese-like domain-containing protein [Methylomirabilota bacterium]|nr:rhodanese-like domain-containing protein [Methylomirabilota bacterium]
MTREAFIAEVTRDTPETPIYYLHSRDTNKAGPRLDAERPMPPMVSAPDAAARAKGGAVVLDTRLAGDFGAAHAAGSLNVPLDGQFASWVGTLVPPDQEIVLIADRDRIEEAVMRLARVGYENVVGVLEGGVEAWRAAGLPIGSTAQVQAASLAGSGRRVLDVRRAREWEDGHLPGATHIPLAELPKRAGELDQQADWAVICASGYRSSIATSVLERAGLARVANVVGGMAAYQAAGLPVESGATSKA